MFNIRRISELEDQVRTLKGQVMGIRLAHLTINGKYKFEVGEELEILSGRFKVQNRVYSDESKYDYKLGRGHLAIPIFIENLTPLYCLVGLDNEDVIYIEEAKLMNELADFKSINKRTDID